ncbi:NmrA family transcriptional regulator, partial [Streptomyces sp. SID3915]|nr:NmrA family transcriptional regulator [Streptomyces sp. SID3915]
ATSPPGPRAWPRPGADAPERQTGDLHHVLGRPPTTLEQAVTTVLGV